MTIYHTICGKTVRKSGASDTTGFRETEDCGGCPFLLPYGPFKWDNDKKHSFQDIQGYECRMPQSDIEYQTRFSGNLDDKCTCRIVSLDFSFLTVVSNWINDTYPDGEIRGSFSVDTIRNVEFVSNGRYRMTVGCAQNNAGVAAKAALFQQFFNDDGSRKDMDPDAEKAKILNDIQIGLQNGHESASDDENDDGDDFAQFDACLCKKCVTPGCHEDCHGNDSPDDMCLDCVSAKFVDGGCDRYIPRDTPISCPHISNTGGCNLSGGFYTKDMSTHLCCTREWFNCKKIKENEGCVKATADQRADLMEEQTSCKDPGSHADVGLATPTPSDAEPVCSAPAFPAFDYIGLPDQTIAILHSAEDIIRGARRNYISAVADAVGMAHDELCQPTGVHKVDSGKFVSSEDTFISWCRSVGLNKTTAYKLLQVSNLMSASTPNEQQVLEQAPPSLLYAAARPSAPAELVEGVKSGDITTHKQYQDLLSKLDDAKKTTSEAERRAKEAEKERDGAKQALEAVKIRADHWKEEAEAAKREPIIAQMVDQDEVNRLAEEKAKQLTDGLRKQLEDLQDRMPDEDDDTHSAFDAVILACRTFDNCWQTVRAQWSKIPKEQRESARNKLLQQLMLIKEEVCKCP